MNASVLAILTTGRATLRPAVWLRMTVATAGATGLVLVLASAATAGLCGDDVDGARVPCACGDVVVSDTQLRPTDPVTRERCPADGLFIKVPSGLDGLRLDLQGLSIVGRGVGTGIRIVHGGGRGVSIVGGTGGGNGEVSGFDTGVFAHGSDPVEEVRDLDVRDNVSDGVSMVASGVRVLNVRAEGNGRDGFRLRGYGSTYLGLAATENSGAGMRLSGNAAVVSATLSGNGSHGALIFGRDHDLSRVSAARNAGDGIRIYGRGHRTDGARSTDNAGEAIVAAKGVAR